MTTFFGRELGTAVKNPMSRAGNGWGYSPCNMCGKLYTQLGLPRHWDKCPKRPQGRRIHGSEASA